MCWNETTRQRTQSGVGLGLTSPWRTSYGEAPHTCQIDWFGKVGNLSVVNANGVEMPLLDDDAFCRRVSRFRRIIMVGPSHMRYKFNYISLRRYHVFGPDERRHGSARVNGTTFLLLQFMANISHLWTMHLDPMNLTKDDAVIIQHGSHNVSRIGLRHTLDTTLNTYFDRLKAIQRHSELLGFRLVVLTSPPLNDRKKRRRVDGRNPFSLAVLARLAHTVSPSPASMSSTSSLRSCRTTIKTHRRVTDTICARTARTVYSSVDAVLSLFICFFAT